MAGNLGLLGRWKGKVEGKVKETKTGLEYEGKDDKLQRRANAKLGNIAKGQELLGRVGQRFNSVQVHGTSSSSRQGIEEEKSSLRMHITKTF